MKTVTYRGLTVPVLVAIVLVLGGCGQRMADKIAEKALEETIERAAEDGGDDVDVDVDVSSGKMTVTSTGTGGEGETVRMEFDEDSGTITTADGTSEITMGKGAKMPDDFPKDVPVYKNATIQMAGQEAAQGMMTVSMTCPDAFDKVVNFYEEQASAQGWHEQMSMNQGGTMQMLSYSKDDRILNVTVSQTDEGTGIHVNTGTQ